MDVGGGAVPLVPGMLQVPAKKDKVKISDILNVIPHNSSCTVPAFNEVEFHDIMPVKGICENPFVPVYNTQTLVFLEFGNYIYDIRHNRL
jgi:hypothetical protein